MSSPLADARADRTGQRKPWMRRLAIPIALLVTASACGTSSSTASGDNEAADDPLEYESPLGDFLGWNRDYNSDDEQEKWKEEERKVEEAVAVCMQAEGFDYTPVDTSQYDSFTIEEEGLEWGTKGFVEKYGFGASTQMFSQDAVGPDLVGHSYDEGMGGAMTEEADVFVDPNEEYVQSLPETEREAYYGALHGTNDFEWDDTLSDEENEEAIDKFYNEDYVPDGCYNQAWEQGAFGNADYQAFEDEFGDIVEELYERFEADPRVIEARNKVETCMTEAGFIVDLENLEESFYNRTEEIGNNMADPFDGVDFEAMSDEELDAMMAAQESFVLSDADKALLGEIQADEIGTALAMWDCNGGTIYGDSDDLSAIRVELEQDFLEKHKDALAPYEGTFG